MKRINIILFSLVLLLTACQKEEVQVIEQTPIINPPTEEVTGQVRGHVTNINGASIEGAEITFKGHSVTTNDKGIFELSAEMYADGTYLEVSKPGYFDGSRKFYPVKDDLNFVKIQLVPKTLIGTISTTTGGSLLVEAAEVDLPAGAYRDAQNRQHNGTVNVYAHYLDPTEESTLLEMPGDLTGVTEDSELRGLVTYGMVNVELEDELGNELQLPEGETATLSMPVPEELQGSAPSSIPLWYFDTDNGTWVEEGSAQLIGGEYVGEVSHFTYWNCDDPFEFVCLEGSLNFNGAHAANFNLHFTAPALGLSGMTVTTASSYFSIKVPKDYDLSLVINSGCGAVAEIVDLGSFSMDTDLGTVNVSATVEDFTIIGTLVTCNGDPVTQGHIKVYIENDAAVVAVEDDGTFEHTFSNCSGTEAYIVGYDLANLKQSDPITITASGFADLGTIVTCNDYEPYNFVIEYQGQNWAIANPDEPDEEFLIGTYADQIVPVSGGPDKILRTVTILDWWTATTAEGTFIYNEGDLEADYTMDMPQGFSIAGTCPVQHDPGFLLTGTSTDITINDASIAPANLSQVYFFFRFY